MARRTTFECADQFTKGEGHGQVDYATENQDENAQGLSKYLTPRRTDVNELHTASNCREELFFGHRYGVSRRIRFHISDHEGSKLISFASI